MGQVSLIYSNVAAKPSLHCHHFFNRPCFIIHVGLSPAGQVQVLDQIADVIIKKSTVVLAEKLQ